MHVWAAILGAVMIFSILLDAFETIVLPRRVQRGFRLTALFYRKTWRLWSRAAQHIRKSSRRENFLGYFGPLSLIVLLGIWLVSLICGFALVQYGLGEHLQTTEKITVGTLLYHSGETFFTLGYGDITPNTTAARFLAVMEAGMGFAFLGVVIGYLPVVYSAFSTREIEISLLDARAGSPPSAAEFLGRLGLLSGSKCPGRYFSRLGTLVCRSSVDAHFVSGAAIFPVATRQPILAGRANRDARRDLSGHDRSQGHTLGPGEADIRHGAACHRGSFASPECGLRRS